MAMYEDRKEAGEKLAQQLHALRKQDLVVLGLPRGGVPVAFEVAAALNAPLDVIVVRKLGLPHQPEIAMGAIGEGDAGVLDTDLIQLTGVTAAELRAVREHERDVLNARVSLLRHNRRRLDLTGRTALIVDDGMATGATVRVACKLARQLGAARVIVAVPVASAKALGSLKDADDVACLLTPDPFIAVSRYYWDFEPTTDEEVIGLLETADRRCRRDAEDSGRSMSAVSLQDVGPG